MSTGVEINKQQIRKKKMENFWYYYKYHTIAAIFIVIVLIITLKDCANNVRPDVTIDYIGQKYVAEEFREKIGVKLSEMVFDINNDDKNVVSFIPLTLTEEVKTQQDIAMRQKILIEFAAGDTKIFILDKKYMEQYGKQGAFEPLDEFVKENNLCLDKYPEVSFKIEQTDEETAENTNEVHTYGIPLEENALFEELGFNTEGVYISFKVIPEDDTGKKEIDKITENALKLFKDIINYK